MDPRTYFLPGVNFKLLTDDDQALNTFQAMLKSIKNANWDVLKAEEAEDNGLKGMTLYMKIHTDP
jgi:hypothetical protein